MHYLRKIEISTERSIKIFLYLRGQVKPEQDTVSLAVAGIYVVCYWSCHGNKTGQLHLCSYTRYLTFSKYVNRETGKNCFNLQTVN